MWERRGRQGFGAELIAALGLVFVVAGVSIWATSIFPTVESAPIALYELVMHVLFGVVVLALGIHAERSELNPEARFDVMVWCFSGFLFLFSLTLWGGIESLQTNGLTEAFVSDLVVFGSMGGAFGVIAGINWGHSHQNEALAERNEEQREMLVLLTRLLRHDIRNDMMAIKGHAELAAEHVEPEGESSLNVILQQSESIARLLASTDTLIETFGEDREFERIDLTRVLDSAAASVRDNHPSVTVETDIPDDLWVVADELVQQIFTNLLENAVAHNDPEELTIRLDATRTDDAVEIIISDDGVGIPADLRDEVFELGEQGVESNGDGLGLYLVSRLAELYGGSVDLLEATDGATFRVTLPTAEIP